MKKMFLLQLFLKKHSFPQIRKAIRLTRSLSPTKPFSAMMTLSAVPAMSCSCFLSRRPRGGDIPRAKICSMQQIFWYDVSSQKKSFDLLLECYRSLFVTLTLTPGVHDQVFKNKKIFFPSYKVYPKKLHWKYNSHWAVWALTKLLCTLISYDFW